MRKELLIIALGLFCVAGHAAADVLKVPEGEPTPEVRLPNKGSSMVDVEKKFGAPRIKRPAVGGDTPKHPPITRWDYDSFSVMFEHDKVVDSVIPGAPPKVYNKDQLTPVAASAAPLPPAMPKTMPPPVEAPVVPPEPEAAPTPPPSEASAPSSSAEPAAPPASPAPATTPPPADGSYPDRPAAQTPAEEATPDAPPTPK